MVAIVDYGVGNLFSVISSFKAIGVETIVTGDESEIRKADKILLPGVGAFGDAIKKLKQTGLDKVIIEQVNSGKDLLGICLGMQLLFDRSFEHGEYEGLGLIKGNIEPIADVIPKDLKIPHIGWNALEILDKNNKILKYVKDGDCVYFVHSFYGADCNDVIATTDYGVDLTAAVSKGNVYGCQFHPEKSGEVGLNILRAFCDI